MQTIKESVSQVKFLSWGKKAEVFEGVREVAEQAARLADIHELIPSLNLSWALVHNSCEEDGVNFSALPNHERMEMVALFVENYARVMRERAAGGAA